MSSRTAFWDTSGIVLLCLAQAEAPTARRLHRLHPRIVVWWGTRVEATSAFERVRRDGSGPPTECDRALRRLEVLGRRWMEVQPIDSLRSLACRLVERYPLRAADALQLAAALLWTGEHPRNRIFITYDERLGHAAALEGFTVVPAPL